MKQVEKKTAIITGSGRGIGKETVVLLAHSHLTDSKTFTCTGFCYFVSTIITLMLPFLLQGRKSDKDKTASSYIVITLWLWVSVLSYVCHIYLSDIV